MILGATPHYVATQWQSVDGLRTASRQEGIDLIQMTSTESEVDRRDGAWEEQSWAQTAAGVQVGVRSHRAYANHHLVRSWITDAIGAVVTESTYAYDAFNRVIQTTDGRGAVSSVTFGPAGQTLSQTTPDGTQSFAYDVMGRKVTTTLPDGSQQFMCYTAQGQVSRQWGSQSYPVEYGYDVQGRTTDMLTWRKPVDAESGLTYPQAVNGLVADRTRWIFNLGRLVRKEYADGNGTDYAYTLGGKLATRTWARGIVTTYGYTPAGELALVDYADATPDVAYSYDRLGRQRRRRLTC